MKDDIDTKLGDQVQEGMKESFYYAHI